MRQQKLTCRECGLLFHRTCSCKYFLFSFHFAFSANVDGKRVDKHIKASTFDFIRISIMSVRVG